MSATESTVPRAGSTAEPTPTEPRGTGAFREVLTLGPVLLLAGLLLAWATRHGMWPVEGAQAVAVLVLAQALPGALLWRAVRPRQGWLLEDLVAGFVLGAALAVPTQLAAAGLDAPWLRVAVPVAVVAATLLPPPVRRRVCSARTELLPWWWGLATALACSSAVLGLRGAWQVPVRWSEPLALLPDAVYHRALAGQLLHHFPADYPQVAGEPLTYHYFTHTWVAHLTGLGNVPLDVVLYRVTPVVAAVAAPVLLAFVAVRVARAAPAGPIAAAVAFGIGAILPAPAIPVLPSTPLHTPLSPTQQFGVMVLGLLLLVLVVRWRDGASVPSTGVLVLLLVVAAGAKGSILPVVLAGTLLASVMVLLTRHRRRGTVLLDTALATTVLGGSVLLLFGGGSGGVRLTAPDAFARDVAIRLAGPVDPASTDLAATTHLVTLALTALVALLLANAGVVGLALRSLRRDPLPWCWAGCGISGLCAILFLSHPGMSQYYFLRTAEAPVAVLAGCGAWALLARGGRPLATAAVGAGTGLLAGALLLWPFVREAPVLWWQEPLLISGLLGGTTALVVLAAATPLLPARARAGALVVALMVTALPLGAYAVSDGRARVPEPSVGGPQAVSGADVAALRRLREASDPDDVVMSNKHCRPRPRPRCDHRQFVVAAFAERRVLVEGWVYTRKAGLTYRADPDAYPSYTAVEFWDPGLLALNDGFYADPSAEAARELWDRGVRWVVVWRSAQPVDRDALALYTTPVAQGPRLQVRALDEPA